ncbi:hypothetical protein JF544_10415 [Halobacillus kuroshimensis]|uniref:Uncharacterized protein n=1 Tax=Halobacillus kuroshimensis TaxID=302481 RepID=A0ABS3DWD0_9BACI|nr:hypothetical protein [Halobacillus kuroshimensis]MBN8235663.1 hypothetical protein [Halobacillus kuroshimensis]
MKLVDIYRVKTYVIPEYVENLIQSVLSVDDLQVGQYKNVMWQTKDGMQFVPSGTAVPMEGKIGEKERVTSLRIEFSIPRDEDLLTKVIEQGIYAAHPWDEPVVQVTEEREARKHES